MEINNKTENYLTISNSHCNSTVYEVRNVNIMPSNLGSQIISNYLNLVNCLMQLMIILSLLLQRKNHKDIITEKDRKIMTG